MAARTASRARALRALPPLVVAVAAAALLVHGPIAQDPAYHRFADVRGLLGIPNAADVLSNLAFVAVGAWGWLVLPARSAYRFFAVALVLTGFGSAWYHLAPDDATLLWDRLPIALACAALLAAVHGETHERSPGWLQPALGLAAIASVLWWWLTERAGAGDLRPYLLIQALPVVLLPLWQWLHGSPRADRVAFAAAIGLFIASKLAELADAAVYEALGVVSGHTLKHLLSAAAAALVLARVAARTEWFAPKPV